MNWQPRWRHISQWGSGGPGTEGSGSNNCAEASISRALLEYDPATPARKANPEWALVRNIHDPANPASVQDLIDRISILARGAANGPWNGFTSADGIQQALNAFGLQWQAVYTNDVGAQTVVQRAQQTPLALLWVDGAALWPSSYAGSYFGGDFGWDHILCSLPDGNLINDPLTDVPDKKTDVRYAWDAIQSAIGGAWLLPAPEPTTPPSCHVIAACALKAQPNHLGAPANKVVTQLAAGAQVLLTGKRTPNWSLVTSGNASGWLLTANLKQAG